jgi:hypothetical protein
VSTHDDRAGPDPTGTKTTLGESLVYDQLNVLSHLIASATIVALLGLFIFRAFQVGADSGARSIAAALLPFLVLGYLVGTRQGDRIAEQAVRVPRLLTFLGMFGLGWFLLPVVAASSAVPTGELLVSGCFSVLLGGQLLSDHRDTAMAYSFGFVLGLATAVMVSGLPTF